MANYPGTTLKPRHGNAEVFGKHYAGSAKSKQMKRKKNNFLQFDTKNVIAHEYQNKYRNKR